MLIQIFSWPPETVASFFLGSPGTAGTGVLTIACNPEISALGIRGVLNMVAPPVDVIDMKTLPVRLRRRR
jgi:hypothetical protein